MGGSSTIVAWQESPQAGLSDSLTKALQQAGCHVHRLESEEWDPQRSTIGGVRDIELTYLAPAGGRWRTALFHLNFSHGEQVAASMSAITSAAAVAVHEYDQSAWGYSLFVNGKQVDRFCNDPAASGDDPDSTHGNAAKVAIATGVPVDQVQPYVRRLSAQTKNKHAFPDDKFELGSHWVRVDFMKRIGISYGSPGQTTGGFYVRVVDR